MTTTDVLSSPAYAHAIRNPEDPNHAMVIKTVQRRIQIYAAEHLIADTQHALRIMEVGKSVYDPVIYVPENDLQAKLGYLEKSTFCPIKGNASYVTFLGQEIGWVYRTPLEMTGKIANHFAFWPDKVRLIEGG